MMRTITVALAGLVALLCLVALLTPWWVVHAEGSGFGGDFDVRVEAGPFDNDDDLITDGEASLAGALVLVALLASLGALVLWVLPSPRFDLPATGAAGLAALLLLLGVILAPVTWPDDGDEFWDDSSASGFGGSVNTDTGAGIGWYLALVTAVVSIGAGVVHLLGLGPERVSTKA